MTQITILTEFVAGQKALANEVNANFQTVKEAHNDTDTRLSTAETSLTQVTNKVNASKEREKLPTIGNNTTDATNDIDITAGYGYDSTDAFLIKLTSALTKRLDALFVAGTNQGGLDAGSKANSTWYHVFIIAKADGTSDVLFSTSATAPTMPTDFIYKRRIASIRTEVAGGIKPFIQNGDVFEYVTPVADVSTSSPVAGLLTLTVPLGVPTIPIIAAKVTASGGGTAAFQGQLCSPSVSTYVAPDLIVTASAALSTSNKQIVTNNSSQIRLLVGIAAAYMTLQIATSGYIDFRGKN